ncbi:uncharacterized protein [Diadema antillarum]|uniref:uncharacterized protein n=1 Tax=Diadema antillarum TaxID=105358 RepID=UPI003A84BCF1
MKFRQKFLGFTGGFMLTSAVLMVILGQDTAYLQGLTGVNGAAGIPMWTGIVIMMCGLLNLVAAFDTPKKPRDLYLLPFSASVVFANLVALTAASICLGLLSWSLHDVYLDSTIPPNTLSEAVVGLYATVVILACLVFVFAVCALFVDCCGNGFVGWGGPMVPPPNMHNRDGNPYDTYNRQPAIFKM